MPDLAAPWQVIALFGTPAFGALFGLVLLLEDRQRSFQEGPSLGRLALEHIRNQGVQTPPGVHVVGSEDRLADRQGPLVQRPSLLPASLLPA